MAVSMVVMVTRWKSSTSPTAARTTSTRLTGSPHVRAASTPASTSSDSALRRMRVAWWSRRNRLSRVPVRVSLRSSSVMKSSWREIRFWLRRARFTNASATLRRSMAWSTASSRAADCTTLRVSATSATSSRVRTLIGASSGTSTSSPTGVSRTLRTADGRWRSAMAIDCWVSCFSGRTIDRDTNRTAMIAAAITRRAAARYKRLRAWAAAFSSSARAWRMPATSWVKP